MNVLVQSKEIPKIIHQTWKTKNLNEELKTWSDTWKNMCPEFEYRFYDDKDCYEFVKNSYPEYIDLYNDLKPVERADVFRYLILHKYGGVYADMDTSCRRNIIGLVNLFKKTLITGIEYTKNNVTTEFQQWFIAAYPGHNTLIEVVEEINFRNKFKFFYGLLYSENEVTYWLTGPQVFTSVINSTSGPITILDKGYLGSYDTRYVGKHSYLQHHFAGSWKKNWSKERMK